MALQVSLFFLIYTVVGFIAILLAGYSWDRRKVAGGIYFTLLMFAVAEWSTTLALEMLSPDIPSKIFWGRLQYVGIVGCAPLWLLFVAGYTRSDQWTRNWKAATIWIVPALVLGLVASNEWHGLIWSKITPVITDGFLVLVYENGPGALFSAAYSYLLVIVSCTLLVFAMFRCSAIYRRQIWVLLCCTLIVMIGDVVDLAGFNPLPGVDLTPIALGAAGILIFEGAIRYRLLDLAPVVYNNLYTTMNVGIIALDPAGRIIEFNPAAQRFLSLPGDAMGRGLAGIVPAIAPLLEIEGNDAVLRNEWGVQSGDTKKTFEVYVSALPDCNEQTYGRLLMFIDITGCKTAEEELVQANHKLNILSSVTRHDILNKLSVIDAYQDLCTERISDKIALEYLQKQRETSTMIRDQIEFTNYYERIGVKDPSWFDLRTIVLDAVASTSPRNLAINVDFGRIAVYADPLIGKVFSNLIDNTARHGGNVTKGTVSAYETGDGLVIVYGDNGNGIPAGEKEKIFLRGYGSHTGLGLFLIRGILAITGITIRENGAEGKGARFEMVVPAGKYRMG